MALPDKLPRDPMYKTYEMTEADWEEYFECRKSTMLNIPNQKKMHAWIKLLYF